MKRRVGYINLVLTVIILIINAFLTKAEDLVKIVQLSGYWKFSIGDYQEWSKKNYDDSDWDEIRVPASWESQGYSDYNGYGWYRKEFRIDEVNNNSPLYLVFGRIDDVDEVFLNGKLISITGSFPPDFETAYNSKRKYLIPKDLLDYNSTNIIAIRVYDTFGEGGIVGSPSGIYIDEDYSLLNLSLSGKWKFKPGDNKQWKSPDFNDNLWNEIAVPDEWEHQGYDNYDGYAWYRTKFVLPAQLKQEELYLSLGKIDDFDMVFLNGKLIGNVFDLKKDGEYKMKGYEYNARRTYKIPVDVLNKNGTNVIAIRVYDKGLRGGIYEGPIGIMTKENHKEYRRKHYKSQSFIDFVIDEFFID
ncbi:MAG: beta galactosidase jelly roll domain-containing protein [Bacteroidales bacterium]|nr:beta galactosidase jelly roll domain-containing protein [Bacteroidales bacterium]